MAAAHSTLAQVCSTIGTEIACKQTGFVPVQRLLDRFRAKLILRPLLVEGMFAELEDDPDSNWAVLIDSESFDIDLNWVQNESHASPLPYRLRNTIAHELVHSLAFREQEFGVRFSTTKGRKSSTEELLKEIEAETEKLSPYLLLPDAALAQILSSDNEPLSPDRIRSTCADYGVSPYLLINRLRRLPIGSPFRNQRIVRNLGIGLFVPRKRGYSTLLGWPLFMNFDEHIIPKFLLDLSRSKSTKSTEIISDCQFAMHGGSAHATKLVAPAGTPRLPDSHTMEVELLVENSNAHADGASIFVARRIPKHPA